MSKQIQLYNVLFLQAHILFLLMVCPMKKLVSKKSKKYTRNSSLDGQAFVIRVFFMMDGVIWR